METQQLEIVITQQQTVIDVIAIIFTYLFFAFLILLLLAGIKALIRYLTKSNNEKVRQTKKKIR